MTTGYYIEGKAYWKDAYGTDHQVADGGELPIIYSSRKNAAKRVKNMIKVYTGMMGYTVTVSDKNHPDATGSCIYACSLRKENPEVRLEVRVYEITIH